jgi:hypothetical protein
MNATELLSDLTRQGIRLEAQGERLRYFPRSAVTADLIERMKAHKGELLAMVAAKAGEAAGVSGRSVDHASKVVATGAPELIKSDVWPAGSIAPDAITQCSECGSLELWQTVAGNWRCLRCDPPTVSRRLAERAAKIRKQSPRAPLDEQNSRPRPLDNP